MRLVELLEQTRITTPIVVLAGLLLCSAVAVIVVKHQSRQVFTELQKAEKQRDKLNEEWVKLLLEEGTWASPARVEQEAASRLKMLVPDNDMTVVIKP